MPSTTTTPALKTKAIYENILAIFFSKYFLLSTGWFSALRELEYGETKSRAVKEPRSRGNGDDKQGPLYAVSENLKATRVLSQLLVHNPCS